jgi:hypothetical protein
MIVFVNTISNLTFLRLDNEEIVFFGRIQDDDYLHAVKKEWAEPKGNWLSFLPDGEKKFFTYIKDKMKTNGLLRNNRRKSISKS